MGVCVNFPILQGLSGGPLLTYHNGIKIAGMVYGNIESRITLHEIENYEDERKQYCETVHRVVELGVAHTEHGLSRAAAAAGTEITVTDK